MRLVLVTASGGIVEIDGPPSQWILSVTPLGVNAFQRGDMAVSDDEDSQYSPKTMTYVERSHKRYAYERRLAVRALERAQEELDTMPELPPEIAALYPRDRL